MLRIGQLTVSRISSRKASSSAPSSFNARLASSADLGPSRRASRHAQHRRSPVRPPELRILGAWHRTKSDSLVAMGALMGGHVRVGLEDSLFLGRGLRAPSCAAQVLKVRRILEDLSLEIARPAEARGYSSDQGADRVGSMAEATRPRLSKSRAQHEGAGSSRGPRRHAGVDRSLRVDHPGFATLGNLSVILSNSPSLILLSCGMAVVIISAWPRPVADRRDGGWRAAYCTLVGAGLPGPLAIILAVLAMAAVGSSTAGSSPMSRSLPCSRRGLRHGDRGLFPLRRPARRISVDPAENQPGDPLSRPTFCPAWPRPSRS